MFYISSVDFGSRRHMLVLVRPLLCIAFTLALTGLELRGEDAIQAGATPSPTAGFAGIAVNQTARWEKRASFGPGRILHSAIWTYHEMIVWGGGSEHQFYNGGGIYEPLLDRWRTVSETGAPSGRWGHAAVWTGKEMIVWGGRSSFSPSNHHRDGGIYDPHINQWRPMSSEGAPEARSQMAAVWTGEELIVWGGWADGGKCPTAGGVYNLREDRWRELPMDGAPKSRMEPASVWTGTEMIVWGGLLEGERVSSGTGARYNPDTNKWTPLPATGAPEAVRGHQAVWTGKEMIVWGGANLDETTPLNRGLNTGAAYSPGMDRWRPLPVLQALEGRLYYSAAWTGTEMVVWGGGDQERGNLATGACYDPEQNRWSLLPTDNAPSARSMCTAVWTGDGLLIYGGSTGGSSAFAETYALRIGAD